MNTPVDLSQTLEGHVILWAKGHYEGKTFDDVVTAYTGWDGHHCIKEKTRIALRALTSTKQHPEFMLDSMISHFFVLAAQNHGHLSSYHLKDEDTVRVDLIFRSVVSSLLCEVSVEDRSEKQILKLPEPMPKERFREQAS